MNIWTYLLETACAQSKNVNNRKECSVLLQNLLSFMSLSYMDTKIKMNVQIEKNTLDKMDNYYIKLNSNIIVTKCE